MGDPQLRPEERRLKDLLTSLDIIPVEDISVAADEVRLIRQYDGKVDLKERLVDLGLVQARQIDAIERGLGMKPAEAEGEQKKASEIHAPEKQAYIDMSRLQEGAAKAGKAGALGNLRLGSKPAPVAGGGESVVSEDGEAAGTRKAKKAKKVVDHSVKGGFVPSWKKKKEEEGPAEDEEEEAEAAPVKPPALIEHEKRVQAVIRHIVHGRQHERILDFLIRSRMNIVEPVEVAKNLGMKERQVRQILEDLKSSGVIKDIGTHPYALSPSHKDLEDLKFFFRLWQKGEWHSKMLAWILDEEKKRG